jgi:hypothetical protein
VRDLAELAHAGKRLKAAREVLQQAPASSTQRRAITNSDRAGSRIADYAPALVGVDQVRGRRYARCRPSGPSADIRAHADERTRAMPGLHDAPRHLERVDEQFAATLNARWVKAVNCTAM